MNATLNTSSISGKLGAGSMVIGDYTIRLEQIDGGNRLTVTRGSEIQTADTNSIQSNSRISYIIFVKVNLRP